MAVEIERKFRVVGDAWRAAVGDTRLLRQAYLGHGACSTRVRIVDQRAWLSLKSMQAGISRQEFEYAIPLADAQALLQIREGAIVEKYRHRIVRDALVWEVDEFLGENAGLLIAEIELPDEAHPVPVEDWLGAEVSDQRRYYNHELAMTPFSRWKDHDPC